MLSNKSLGFYKILAVIGISHVLYLLYDPWVLDLFVSMILILILLFELNLFKSFKRIPLYFIYPGVPFLCLIYLNHHQYREILAFIFYITFSRDVGSYVSNRIYKPNKENVNLETFEEFCFGYFCSLITAMVFFLFNWSTNIFAVILFFVVMIPFILIVVLLSAFGQNFQKNINKIFDGVNMFGLLDGYNELFGLSKLMSVIFFHTCMLIIAESIAKYF
jgi:hypothetical protein